MMMYFFIMFFSGVWVFCSNRNHLLITLLSLEFMVLVLYFIMYFYMIEYNYEFYFNMIFLTFSVCEGSLGLSLLVSMIRMYGNDYFNVFSLLQC